MSIKENGKTVTIVPKAGDVFRFLLPPPAAPTVCVGDRVLCGQAIARADNESAACVHSGVSGTVKEITQALSAQGDRLQAIVVENDGQMEAYSLDAADEDQPLTRHVITLSGRAFEHPGHYDVCIGMRYQDIISAAGGFKIPPKKIVSGDAMTGHCLFHLDVPLTKDESSILAFTGEEVHICEESPCIRCSRCADSCQIRLLPYELNALFLASDFEGFEQNGGPECIECGSCSYSCPSKRHLTQSIRAAKKSMALKSQCEGV